MMSKNQEMWGGHLETMPATEHCIKSGTRSIREMLYSQEQAKREIIRDHIDAMLREEVIEPS